MARLTVNQIMTQIASTVNQEASAPDVSSSEWNLWLQYINRAYQEWAEASDWEALRKTFFPVTTGLSTASISLPLDYRKMASNPLLHVNSDRGVHYAEVPPEESPLYNLEDKYFTVVGDHSVGKLMVLNPPTIASGASLEVSYFSVPTSLATSTEIPLTPDPQFLVDRTIAFIFEARSDPRFQIEENKSRERLLTMVENLNAAKYNSYSGKANLITPEKRIGFRLGRD